nr:hypothetical protein [Tanacetum cinerariifolium]
MIFRFFLVKKYVFQASELGHCLKIISASYVTVPASCENSTLWSELTSFAGSELGSELTFFAGSELGQASYRSSEDYFPATYEQELCPFNFLLASCQVSSSELSLASYKLIEYYFPVTCEQKLCPFNFLLASCQVSSSELSLGKENEVNILKSIDEGPFQMGTLRETLTEGTKGETMHDYYVWFAKLINDMRNIKMTMSRMQLNSKFVNNMLPEWGRFVTAVKLNRGLRDSNYDQLYAYLKQHEGAGAAGYGGAQNRVRYANPGQARRIKYYNCNGIGHIVRNYTQPKRPQNSKYFKDKMLLMQAQENGVTLDEEQLLFIAADDCNAFDFDIDEAPTAQTMFMVNLSSTDPVNDVSSPSYDSDVLSEETRSNADRTLDFRVENAKVKQHYKELEFDLEYLKHLKESVATLHEIVEEDKKYVEKQITQKTNVIVLPSTGVDSCTNASESKPMSNTKKNRISPAKSVNKKTVEDHSRTNKSQLQKLNHVDSSISSKRTVINSNFDYVCKTCNKCFISANHDMCVIKYLNSVNATSSAKNVVRKVKQAWKPKHVKQVWKATGKVLTTVGYQWKPTERIFTLGEQCPLTRFTHPKVVPAKQPEHVSTSNSMITENSSHTSQKLLTRYQRRNKQNKAVPVGIPTPTDAAIQSIVAYIVLWYLDSGCSKHMIGDRSRLRNFMKKFIGTVRFGNDHFGDIMRQFCDFDLEVVFKKHSCYVRDTASVELIEGSRGFNLYTISVEDIMKSSPICLLSKASKTKSWLWHRRLNHLNFGTINDLERKDLKLLLLPVTPKTDLLFTLIITKPHISENLGKLQPTADIGIFVGYATKPERTRSYISDAWADKFRARTKSGSCSTLCTPPPTKKDLEILFRPMFDEYLEPPRVDRPVSPALVVLVLVNSAGTPLSTAIDQDAPSSSHSLSSSALQSPCLHQGVTVESTLID